MQLTCDTRKPCCGRSKVSACVRSESEDSYCSVNLNSGETSRLRDPRRMHKVRDADVDVTE